MNKRIKLISETKVGVHRDGSLYSVAYYEIKDGRLERRGSIFESWDIAGLEADALVNACFRQTRDFAALADTSPVPFVGKRMRRQADGFLGTEEKEVVIVSVGPCGATYHGDGCRGTLPIDKFLPLTEPAPPKPVVRPYTAREAGANLGRTFLVNGRSGESRTITAADMDGVYTPLRWQFDELVKQDCVWEDTGEPCGVPE